MNGFVVKRALTPARVLQVENKLTKYELVNYRDYQFS
jgi:hypothetical protein